jgi:hypothetical protein
MPEFINWLSEFTISILTMIGVTALFLAWSYYAEKKYDKSDQATKRKIDDRRGIILSIGIGLLILLVVWASISSIFF